MKKTALISGMLLAVSLMPSVISRAGDAQSLSRAYEAVPDFGRIPLYFIPNQGQRDSRALYYARTSRYTLWLTKDGMVYDSFVSREAGASPGRDVSRLEFPGAKPDSSVVAVDPSDYRVSYFEGSDPGVWRSGLPTSCGILYQNLYDGIDLKVYGVEREVEYDWIVRAGGDPGRIRMAFRGVRKTGIDHEGNLAVETESGAQVHRRPSAYQVIDGRRAEIAASFKKTGADEYGFRVGPYDRAHDLIIDPYVVVYSTYVGGGLADVASGIAVDPEGGAYIAGFSYSGDYPTSSSKVGDWTRSDDFVTKISSDGRSLVYTVFLAVGFRTAEGFRYPKIAVDAAGAAYIVGTMSTASFPIKNAFQPKYGGGYFEGFVTKISPDGRSLAYSSFVGGSGSDGCSAVAVDAKGAAYIIGISYSRNLRTKNAFQPKLKGDLDAFALKVAPGGQTLSYSTYLGGAAADDGRAIAVDGAGSAYLMGETESSDFPLKSAYQKVHRGEGDLFLSKLSPDGRSLVYSTYWGGQSYDASGGVAVDGAGSAYVSASTDSTIAMKKAFQPNRRGSSDIALAKFAPNGQSIVFSTYLGGSRYDWSPGLAVDGKGAVYIAGGTDSSDFPRKNALQTTHKGQNDACVVKLAPDGQKLEFSTFLGGAYLDYCFGIALGSKGEIYVCGRTRSLDFPTVKAYQDAFAGGDYDAFVTKYAPQSKIEEPKRH